MPDDIKIGVSTPGAPEAQRRLKDVAKAEREVGGAARQTGREAEQSARRHAGGLRNLWQTVKRLAGAYLGLRGAQKILASLRAETERVDEATRKATESLRAIMALSALQGERREVREAVWDMAVRADLPIEQVAPAYYTLLGGTAGMPEERRLGLMQQALLFAKTDPSANLNAVVSLFSTMATQQAQLSPQQIGNLVSKTIEQAKSTPEEMAAYLPSILTTARAGRADVGTAAALFSFATRAGGGVAESGTAVRAALLGLLAPSPDVAKQLGGFGYEAAAGLPEKIAWLAQRGGELPPEIVAALGGRRGLEAVAAIAERPAEYAAEVEMMRGALAMPGSHLRQRLAGMYGEDAAQRYLDQLKQLEVMLERERVEPEALWLQSVMKLWELVGRRRGVSPAQIDMAMGLLRTRRYVGLPIFAPGADIAEADVQAMMELLREGYTPADLYEHVVPFIEGQETPATFGSGEARKRRVGEEKEKLRRILRKAGVNRMQDLSVNYQGGTHFHGAYEDPAGRIREPANSP